METAVAMSFNECKATGGASSAVGRIVEDRGNVGRARALTTKNGGDAGVRLCEPQGGGVAPLGHALAAAGIALA